MTQETITLVQDSWKKVEAIAPQVAALFYNNLFSADPSLKKLFTGDMTLQGQRLMEMIGLAVNKLNDLQAVVPVLQQLAKRHVKYGVKEADYTTVGAALLQTLGQGLGSDFTPSVREAWSSVYSTMASVMIAATKA
ncbi:MAG: hemin receptor [Deltaproteobacteria bacterium]|nr:hemin receptor [Deltaproteobacteria bacterium]